MLSLEELFCGLLVSVPNFHSQKLSSQLIEMGILRSPRSAEVEPRGFGLTDEWLMASTASLQFVCLQHGRHGLCPGLLLIEPLRSRVPRSLTRLSLGQRRASNRQPFLSELGPPALAAHWQRAGRHRAAGARHADWPARRVAQPMGQSGTAAVQERQHGPSRRPFEGSAVGPGSRPGAAACRRPVGVAGSGHRGAPLSATRCEPCWAAGVCAFRALPSAEHACHEVIFVAD